ncbi:hypothetical protein AAVH_24525 [Aphelenchoides avenae]|nr:hypothetical protein AAVH_24525 [Aphelenchus avenae]
MSSDNKSFVPCDIAFWKNYSAALGQPYYGHEWEAWYNQSTVTLIAYIIFVDDLHRFIVYVVAMLLLGICFVVSLNEKVEDPSMRFFVWNCCLVNGALTVFACAQWILNVYVHPETELCYFTSGVLPGTEILEDNGEPGFFSQAYGTIDFYTWTVYSVCVSLTFVRSTAYRACTRPMSYKNQEVNTLYWCAAIVASDLVPLLVIYLSSPVYGPRIPPLMRTIISFGFIAVIWFVEGVLSLLSVVAIYRYRNTSDAALLPGLFIKIQTHVYISAQQVAMKKCLGIDNIYDFDYYDREEMLEDCDAAYFGVDASAIQSVMNEMLYYCFCLIAWKPHCEALMILFLLPRFRAVFIGKIRSLFAGRKAKVVHVTTSA